MSGKFPAEDISPDLKQWPVIFIPLWGGEYTRQNFIHFPYSDASSGLPPE
jgi:hypothetical protein